VIDAKTGPPLTLGQWTQLSKLTVTGARELAPVAATRGGDVMVLGAPGTTVGPNPSQGIAYVFIKPANGWSSATVPAATQTREWLGRYDRDSRATPDIHHPECGALLNNCQSRPDLRVNTAIRD